MVLNMPLDYMHFFISNTFISNTRLKLKINHANAKQHPEAKLLLFEHYSLSSFMLSSKTNMRYSNKCAKNKCVCFNPNKTGLFEGSFFWTHFIFQEELIQYQYNFIQLLNKLFKVG